MGQARRAVAWILRQDVPRAERVGELAGRPLELASGPVGAGLTTDSKRLVDVQAFARELGGLEVMLLGGEATSP